jgi:3-hydroxyacyl-[acyl-carrier-protein] dehydratase
MNILESLPHKYPFIFVDRVLEKQDKSIITLKNVSHNEPYFAGHFPGYPVMPGVYILESMFQSAGLLYGCGHLEPGQLAFVASVDKVKFRKPVIPGDQIKFNVNLMLVTGNLVRFNGTASVDETIVAEAAWTSLIVDHKE